MIWGGGNSTERGFAGTDRAGFQYRLKHLPPYGFKFLNLLSEPQ